MTRSDSAPPSVLRCLVGALLGAAVLAVWGMVFWGLLAGPLGLFHALPKADEVTRLLDESGTRTGTYFFPWPHDTPAAFDAFVEQHRRGPFYKLSFVREGVDPNSPTKILLGTLHYVTVAALAAGLVRLVCDARFAVRAGAVLLAGLMGTNFINVADRVWFHLPWDYVAGTALFEVVSWALLGCVVASVVRTSPAAAGAADA